MYLAWLTESFGLLTYSRIFLLPLVTFSKLLRQEIQKGYFKICKAVSLFLSTAIPLGLHYFLQCFEAIIVIWRSAIANEPIVKNIQSNFA